MLQRAFIRSVGVILVVTSLLKVGSIYSKVAYLNISDTVFNFLSIGHLLLLVGIIELCLALYLLWERRIVRAAMFVAFFSNMLLCYRLGVFWIDPPRPCPCLGRLTDWIDIPPELADQAMRYVLIYMLVGSYSILFNQLWSYRKRAARKPLAIDGAR